jgi:hypothetical protein
VNSETDIKNDEDTTPLPLEIFGLEITLPQFESKKKKKNGAATAYFHPPRRAG